MVIDPPLIAVVPVPPLKLAAAIVLLIVVVPLVVRPIAPNAVPDPTAPVKVTPPLPLDNVNARALLLLKLDPKVTKLFVVVKVVAALRVTVPLYA